MDIKKTGARSYRCPRRFDDDVGGRGDRLVVAGGGVEVSIGGWR